MKINSHCWLRTALQRLQCIFITLSKYSNKRRIGLELRKYGICIYRVYTLFCFHCFLYNLVKYCLTSFFYYQCYPI